MRKIISTLLMAVWLCTFSTVYARDYKISDESVEKITAAVTSLQDRCDSLERINRELETAAAERESELAALKADYAKIRWRAVGITVAITVPLAVAAGFILGYHGIR